MLKRVPDVTFRTRVRDDSIEGPNPFRWEDKTSADYFGGKKVILFSLPGAFTPTCSTYQLPDFEKLFDEFKAEGIEKYKTEVVGKGQGGHGRQKLPGERYITLVRGGLP